MAEPTVAAGFARALMELAVSKGADRKTLVARSGIASQDLDNQDNRISLDKYVALMRAGKELSGDPALALHFGETFDMSELSIVGLIADAAANMAEALTELNRYARLVVEVDLRSAERFRLDRQGRETWMIDTRKDPNDFPELTESFFARSAVMARRYARGRPLIRRVRVTHSAPSYRAEYQRIFQVPVQFASDKNGLLLAADVWSSRSSSSSTKYVFALLCTRAEELLKSLETSQTTRGRIESELLPILHTGEASMARLATKLGMSRQTLFRRLKAEGTTFERVLDELRHRMALQYLNGKKVSVNETAYLLGFSEPAAFSRAFKRWTGSSPSALRGKN